MSAKFLISALAMVFFTSQASAKTVVVNQVISEQEVVAAQNNWCKALLDIGGAYEKNGHAAAKELAAQVIDGAYGYQLGAVLFKPTLTVNPQTFRTTSDGALSYFVGGDSNFPQDTGFALKGWKKCEVDNAAIYLEGDSALTMGKVHFVGKDGKKTTVDKTWGYVKDAQGSLRIVLHHSSLEYAGK
ncbi:phosphoribosyl-AMP cyclohydrolase [Formosimonas limnophila]|uniref:Phosphoribosyl-AMP cyclohydrolase n=1 Tax=Formosimonas limnophila TaxID=1384487 RepID=A0A8J3CKY8_9BURK|nr:hypothetical protein [Formosimonas limnophila]GHA64129.1 phosphoribosyl-AMP cyclohydrolase [Formosimonas limnophila]